MPHVKFWLHQRATRELHKAWVRFGLFAAHIEHNPWLLIHLALVPEPCRVQSLPQLLDCLGLSFLPTCHKTPVNSHFLLLRLRFISEIGSEGCWGAGGATVSEQSWKQCSCILSWWMEHGTNWDSAKGSMKCEQRNGNDARNLQHFLHFIVGLGSRASISSIIIPFSSVYFLASSFQGRWVEACFSCKQSKCKNLVLHILHRADLYFDASQCKT